MALKTFKPYTKSSRGTILVDRTGLWKGKPFKSLVSPKNAMKGRNNNGHITSINRAGGHKKMYRHVDFYRKKFDMEATVERVEYDPNRSCYIMLVKFEDGTHAYFLAPQKIKVGDKILFPLITEKSTNMSEQNKIVFKVPNGANKKNLKNNIEKIFKVNVTKINIINKQSRTKLTRNRKVKVSGYKKAIITLKKGQSIDLTTGV